MLWESELKENVDSYRVLVEKNLDVWRKVPLFQFEKYFEIVLRKINDEYLWINEAYLISREAIEDVTSLCSFEPAHELKAMDEK